MKFNYNSFDTFYDLLKKEPSKIEQFKIEMKFLHPFDLILPASYIFEKILK